jgi:hypothetical protein
MRIVSIPIGIVSIIFIGTVKEYPIIKTQKSKEVKSIVFLNAVDLMFNQINNANKPYSERVVKLIIYLFRCCEK